MASSYSLVMTARAWKFSHSRPPSPAHVAHTCTSLFLTHSSNHTRNSGHTLPSSTEGTLINFGNLVKFLSGFVETQESETGLEEITSEEADGGRERTMNILRS